MHKCAFCNDPIPAYDKPMEGHLIIAKDLEGHIHTHGCINKKELTQELIESASESAGLTSKISGEPPKEIVFHNRQRIGDILMFTCGIRDFKAAFPNTRVNVISTCSHIWDHNPNIDRTLTPTEENTLKIGPGRLTNASNRLDWHFANAYRVSIEDALKIHIPQGESRPDIYITEEEYHAPRLFKDPYWVICITGEKSWGCKMYPYDRWQEVINKNKDLTFVQIGAKEDNPPRLQGENVIDYVGKTQDKETGIRDLFKLFLNAEGSIGLVSFHMHLSGGLYKPSVVVAGAREPVSFTRFPGHQYLATDGTLPCSVSACWHCAIEKCKNPVQYENKLEKIVPKCVDIIHPDDISRAINSYYAGGRLKKGVPSNKPKLKNIVKAPVQVPVKKDLPNLHTKYGIDFGTGAIPPDDWEFLKETIAKNNVKTVLEFGAGLSTLLMSELCKVTSFETDQEWIDKVKKIKPDLDIRKWNGRDMTDVIPDYDMAFVDGPANGENREQATRIAANQAKIVIVHDASRMWESRWEDKYLKTGFYGPIKGARWCHLWIKSNSFINFETPPLPAVHTNRKLIKIISTARGWGGAQRSVTTIMKMLLREGHSVEFIPFHKEIKSNEFRDCLNNGLMDVKVHTTFDAISEPCDVLLCYADDFVWEFPKSEVSDAFMNMKADKRIMMVNYRRGGIGEIPWTRDWDRYLFLNSAQEKDLLRVHPGVSTAVYPPCTDLTLFFESKPNFKGNVRIVRHNSQGDTKFVKDDGLEINSALDSREDIEIHMMPGPGFMAPKPPKFIKYSRNSPPIPKFLENGNLFWYSLPDGYMDMGPRVILEAMAAGLPILADPWGGAADRVTPETGWLASKEDQLKIIKNVTLEELEIKGKAARERALKEFRPERWIEELTGEPCKVPML